MQRMCCSRKTHPETQEERFRQAHEVLCGFGYRPVVESDIMPGAEVVMVDIPKYFASGQDYGYQVPRYAVACTAVRLTAPAVKSNLVRFHSTAPPYQGEICILIEIFLHTGFRRDLAPKENEVRFYIASK